MDMDGSMGMGMGADSDSGMVPLLSTGVDFSNETQASDFLADMLDDSVFQIQGNQYARYFYYGVVVLVGLFTVSNIYNKVIERSRSVMVYLQVTRRYADKT